MKSTKEIALSYPLIKTLQQPRYAEVLKAMDEAVKQAVTVALEEAAENGKMKFHDGHSKTDKEIAHFQSNADNLTISKDSILSLQNSIYQELGIK